MRYRWLAALISAGALTGSAGAADRIMTDAQWHADLTQMSRAIRDIHFKPFHVVSESDFEAAVDALSSTLPEKTDHQITVAMAQIVALLRDGHTRLHIPRRYPQFALEAELGHSGTARPKIEGLAFDQLPVAFGLFEDGLYVTGSMPGHAGLIGRQVTHIGRLPVADAIERVKTVSFYENEARAKLMAPDRLALPHVLAALGIANTSTAITLKTKGHDGTVSTDRLEPIAGDAAGFVDGTPDPAPLWLGRSDEHQWYQVLPARDAIYVQVNQFAENPARPYADFVAETLARARASGVRRYVIDLRHNSGGVGAWTTPFLTGLARSEYNAYGRLYVLVGRTTFSAAQHFLHKFEEYTYAAFVGEPSGAKPSHFGDPKRVVLDHSGLTLRVSTIYWHSWLANDFREAVEPHIDAPLSAADFFAGRDPALEAALAYQAPATLAGQLDEQFRRQKNQNALLLFNRFMTDGSFEDHRRVVPELRAVAHGLLDDEFTRPGFFLFFLANASFPGDANTLAGLGRAHALMGSPEAAVRHYREALSIDPDNAMARQGLEGLDAPN